MRPDARKVTVKVAKTIVFTGKYSCGVFRGAGMQCITGCERLLGQVTDRCVYGMLNKE